MNQGWATIVSKDFFDVSDVSDVSSKKKVNMPQNVLNTYRQRHGMNTRGIV